MKRTFRIGSPKAKDTFKTADDNAKKGPGLDARAFMHIEII